MIDNSIIFKNPIIPNGYYFAKIKDIETEASDYIFPKILVQLELHKDYGFTDNIFHAIIHPTQNSYYHYKNFFNSFMITKSIDKLKEAIGLWASIKIYKSDFQGSEYCFVKFVYNPREILIESYRIGREENG